jgi:hypothetical protein
MSDSNTAPEVDGLSDDDFNALLDELFGSAPEPEFDEKQSIIVSANDVHVRITVEYPTGHAYEAAQVQAAMGSPLTVATFLSGFPDESVDAKLAELGLDRDSFLQALAAIVTKDWDLGDGVSASDPDAHDALRILRDGADVDALLRA